MDSESMNQYEKQLYSVFKAFDVNNDEALDRSAVLELCESLQLENRGTALVDSLFERRSDRVTFTQFRNGLLSVLGGESPPNADEVEPSEVFTSQHSSRSNLVSPSHSDDDSSGQEVAPKFVVGSKKYGRKSRPQRVTPEESPRHRVSSESRLDCDRTKQRMKCKRSASAMENRSSLISGQEPELDHDKKIDRERALVLCHGLHMSGVERCLIDQIFDSAPTKEITVGEFFEKLNSTLTTSIVSLNESNSDNIDDSSNLISSDSIIEVWEQAGVQKPRRLLFELGFASATVPPVELEQALNDELRALCVSSDVTQTPYSILLLAAHALACLRLDTLRRQFDIVSAQRDKLCVDLGEANRRARLLAQDVDESHVRIEADLKTSLRVMEVKHAEAIKALTLEVASEKENAASARAAFEEELARHTDIESHLKRELDILQKRNEDYQDKIKSTESCLAQVERDRVRLQIEAQQAEEREAAAVEKQCATEKELALRLQELRSENQRLQDRNDELSAELEGTGRRKSSISGVTLPSWLDESGLHDNPASPKNSSDVEVNDPLQLIIDQKLDPKAFVTVLKEILESIHKIPKDGSCHSCIVRNNNVINLIETIKDLCNRPVSDWLMHEPNACTVESKQTTLEIQDESVKEKLMEMLQKHEHEKQNFTSVIKELESSLEQMKMEYERCEEYWQNKVEVERELHLAEQRAGDERLAELVASIAEYERQFTRALPPIDERASLELQVVDMENEITKYRADKEAELVAKEEEIMNLKSKIQELERRQSSGSGCSGGGGWEQRSGYTRPVMLHCAEVEGQLRRQAQDSQACGRCPGAACIGGWSLRARALRAERAVQRLHTRLSAADLLVKDLYIENCRLAHRPHHI